MKYILDVGRLSVFPKGVAEIPAALCLFTSKLNQIRQKKEYA
jgi:hypothetical protein